MPRNHSMRTCDARHGAVVVGHPTPTLEPFVELFWHDDRYRGLTHREHVLPITAFTVVFELDGESASVNGVRSRCIEFDTSAVGTIVGILFRPGGARAFFPGSAHALYNASVALDRVWGPAVHEMCSRLRAGEEPSVRFHILEQVLRSRLQTKEVLHPAVELGLREFQHVPHVRTVLEVVTQTGLSRRRFSQLFREQVGTTPKLYCRLRRFTWVVEQLSCGNPIDWADVAHASGYSDQAHLVRDFHAFSGLSPTTFLRTERPSGAHLRVS